MTRVGIDRSQALTVVAYDVADDRRRQRVADVLMDYGVRLQYSVFECRVDARRLVELKRRIAPILVLPEDRIAYYSLCGACEGRALRVPERDTRPSVVLQA